MNFVKSEMDNLICRGCLCIDRILMPLNKNIDLFFIFLGNELSISEDSKYYNILLCWECIALLKKAEVFRKRVQTAHRYFERQLSTPIQALTTLNTYRKDDYDQILTENPEEPKVKPERLIFEDSLHEEDGAAADCHIKEENYENDDNHFDYEQEEPKPEMPSLVKTEETKKKYKYRPLGRRVKTKSIKYTDEEMDKCIERVEYTMKEILSMERVKNKPNRIKNMEHRCNVHIMKMADTQKRDLKQKVKESGVKCHECSAVLADREALGAHWAAHVVALLRCQFCGLLGKSRKYVAYHVETRHSIIYSCVLCNVDFRALPEYHRHDRSLHKTLICDYCGKKFNQRSGIERHIRFFHFPIQCEICKKVYKRKASLDNHMARCHPKVAWKPVKRELTYCVECDKYFATRDLYRNHLNGAVAHGYRAKYRPPESPRYHLPIQCEICKMVYKREKYLDNHMARCHPEVAWKPVKRELTYCVECDKYFPNVNLYKTHLGRDEPHRPHRPRRREIPLSHLPIQCEICKKVYKKEFSLDNHIARCHAEVKRERTYCVECDMYFATRKLYRHHLITAVAHLPPESPRYHLPIQCEICKMVYKRESTLDNHMARCHPEVKWKPVKRELTYCVECDMHFPTEDLFKRHLRVYVRHQIKPPIKLQFHHLPAVCYICKFEFKRKNYLAEHMLLMHRIEKKTKKPIVEELAYCVECNLQFPSEYFYKRHLTYAVAHKRRIRQKVPCPDCGKIFSRKNYMDNHYKLVHVRKSQHFCELCGKHFINGYAIRTHKKFVHEKHEKPKNKICDICGRGFHTNRVLTNHKRTHTGERPHKCSYCPAAFAQNVARKTHEKTQHKHLLLDPPIKPFV